VGDGPGEWRRPNLLELGKRGRAEQMKRGERETRKTRYPPKLRHETIITEAAAAENGERPEGKIIS
jgi:hypothetical protein